MVTVRSQQATAKKPMLAITVLDLKVTVMLPLLEMGAGNALQKRWLRWSVLTST